LFNNIFLCLKNACSVLQFPNTWTLEKPKICLAQKIANEEISLTDVTSVEPPVVQGMLGHMAKSDKETAMMFLLLLQ
jgi:hypothetical protein